MSPNFPHTIARTNNRENIHHLLPPPRGDMSRCSPLRRTTDLLYATSGLTQDIDIDLDGFPDDEIHGYWTGGGMLPLFWQCHQPFMNNFGWRVSYHCWNEKASS